MHPRVEPTTLTLSILLEHLLQGSPCPSTRRMTSPLSNIGLSSLLWRWMDVSPSAQVNYTGPSMPWCCLLPAHQVTRLKLTTTWPRHKAGLGRTELPTLLCTRTTSYMKIIQPVSLWVKSIWSTTFINSVSSVRGYFKYPRWLQGITLPTVVCKRDDG